MVLGERQRGKDKIPHPLPPPPPATQGVAEKRRAEGQPPIPWPPHPFETTSPTHFTERKYPLPEKRGYPKRKGRAENMTRFPGDWGGALPLLGARIVGSTPTLVARGRDALS